jgi:hypothetical protein
VIRNTPAGWIFCFAVLLAGTFHAPIVKAWTERALEAADPFVFTPNDLGLRDFTIESALPWSWVEGSFEWVRIERRFLVPRARIRVRLEPGTPVTYRGRHFESEKPELELPVVLSQETGNELRVGGANPSVIRPRFKPHAPLKQPIILDASCSSTPLRIQAPSLSRSWGHVICRPTHPNQEAGYGLRMDVDLLWESESPSDPVRIGHAASESSDGVTHSISFSGNTPSYALSKGRETMTLVAPLPDRFRPLAVSLGLGPYSHMEVLRPFATVYAAYLFNDALKMALFSAFPIRKNPEVDTGVYVIVEQFRGIDERVTLNLLLGAHSLSFRSGGEYLHRISAPQGVEMSFRDCLLRTQNLTLGGFFYPKIEGRSYVNAWLRYGNSKFFTEFNFITWQEPVTAGSFSVKSAGLSIGFPLFRAF